MSGFPLTPPSAGTPRHPATGQVTPPQPPDHLHQALETPRGNVDDTNHELHSLLPLLVQNFAKIHACNASILAKLQISEDAHKGSMLSVTSSHLMMSTSSHANPGVPQAHRKSKRVSHESSDLIIASNKSLKSTNGTTKSLESLGEIREIEENPGRFSKSTASMGIMSKYSSLISNREGMDALNKIIHSHSKHILRKGSAAHTIWVFLENRTSSRWAYYYGSYFAPFFLILSVLISFLQTVDDWAMPDGVFTAIQTSFELWFACEISIRFFVCPNKATFWFDTFNLIDFVSIAPLALRIYIMAADLEGEHLQSVIALVPILRLLKILRRFHKFQLLLSAFSIALEALPVLMFSLMLIAIVFSGFIYLVESRSLIPDLPQGIWFVMVTMSTVGYGDIVPETRGGQALSVVLMILSALYMALPIGIVGNAFSEVWKDRDRLLLLAVLRESFAVSGISRALIKDIFEHFSGDADFVKDPEMTFADFNKMLTALQIDVSDERGLGLFQALDEDSSGKISCDEFIHTLFPTHFLNRATVTRPSLYQHTTSKLSTSPS